MGIWKTVGAASGAAAVGLAGWALYDNRRPAGKTYTLEHPDLPAAFDGLRILHLSDLHATMFGKNQERLLAIVDSLEADIAFITGDLIDRRRTMTRDDMTPAFILMEQLARRLPTVRVDGNHELMSVAGKQFVALADRTGESGDRWIAVCGDGRRGALHDARPRTRRLAVKATVGQHAERVDVGGDRRLAALHLFRCAVAGCAHAAKGNVR